MSTNKQSLTEEVSQNIADEVSRQFTKTVWLEDSDLLELKRVVVNVCRVNLAAVLVEEE